MPSCFCFSPAFLPSLSLPVITPPAVSLNVMSGTFIILIKRETIKHIRKSVSTPEAVITGFIINIISDKLRHIMLLPALEYLIASLKYANWFTIQIMHTENEGRNPIPKISAHIDSTTVRRAQTLLVAE